MRLRLGGIELLETSASGRGWCAAPRGYARALEPRGILTPLRERRAGGFGREPRPDVRGDQRRSPALPQPRGILIVVAWGWPTRVVASGRAKTLDEAIGGRRGSATPAIRPASSAAERQHDTLEAPRSIRGRATCLEAGNRRRLKWYLSPAGRGQSPVSDGRALFCGRIICTLHRFGDAARRLSRAAGIRGPGI